MGIWAFFLVVTSLLESVKTNLLKNAHIKFVGNYSNEKTAIASSSFLINVFVSIIFILFLLFLSGILSTWLEAGEDLMKMLQWYSIGMAGLIFFSHLEAVSQSHLDFKSVFAGYFSRQVLFFAIILGLQVFKIKFTLVELAIYQSISIVFGATVMYLFSRKHLSYIFNPSIVWIKKILGFGGYIFGIGIASNIFTNLDQLMIAKFTSSKSMVATYNAATRISGLVEIPSYAAAEILLPKVSQVDLNEGPDRVKYMYERMVGILMSFTTPLALFIICFPNFVITLIAGAQYADSAFILQMYMISGLIRPIQNQAANLLLYIGKARLCFLLNVLFLGINFSLNYLCFLQFGVYGAAIGNVIGCFLGTIVWYSILQKSIGVRFGNIWIYIIDTYKTIFSRINLVLKAKQVQV